MRRRKKTFKKSKLPKLNVRKPQKMKTAPKGMLVKRKKNAKKRRSPNKKMMKTQTVMMITEAITMTNKRRRKTTTQTITTTAITMEKCGLNARKTVKVKLLKMKT